MAAQTTDKSTFFQYVSIIRRIFFFHKYEIVTICLFLIMTIFIPKSSFDSDMYIYWANLIRAHGIAKLYTHQEWFVNYTPPIILLINCWQVFCKLLNIPLEQGGNLLKIVPLFFDLLTTLLLLKIARKSHFSKKFVLLLLPLNVAFHYNSYIWGQFDTIYTFFVFLSIYFLHENKNLNGLLAFLWGIFIKQQTLLFSPIIILIAIKNIFKFKKIIKDEFFNYQLICTTGIHIVIFFLFLIPFHPSHPFEILLSVVEKSNHLTNYVTANANNFWVFTNIKPMSTLDNTIWFWNIRYRLFGYFLFLLSSGSVLLFFSLNLFNGNKRSPNREYIITVLACYLITLTFFFFCTRIHERYIHPAILLSALFAIYTKKYQLALLTSTAYFINLEQLNRYWYSLTPVFSSIYLTYASSLLYFMALCLARYYFIKEINIFRWVNLHKADEKTSP